MIKIEGLTKTLGSKSLFLDLSYQFPDRERIAIVGINGSGKTTLLKVLCGEEQPDRGDVICPKGMRIGYLKQHYGTPEHNDILGELLWGVPHFRQLRSALSQAEKRLEKQHCQESLEFYEKAHEDFLNGGGYEQEAQGKKILSGLGFKDEEFSKDPAHLSGGWRLRLELAKLLLERPDYLILDEPTNHLDLPSMVWIENFLRTFPNTLIFVSHDRTTLDRLATVVVEIENGKLRSYSGNYSDFLVKKENHQKQLGDSIVKIDRQIKDLQLFVDRFGAKASKAAQAQSKQKALDKLEEEKKDLQDGISHKQKTLSVTLPKPPPSSRTVYEVKMGAIGYAAPLVRNVSFQIEAGFKVAVVGPNGIGKTTLLRTISGKIPVLDGDFVAGPKTKMVYVAQNHDESLDAQLSILDWFLRQTNLGAPQARKLLGHFLFSGDDVLKIIHQLSGGEKCRLALCCAFAKEANFLLLDEPTNHLDIDSISLLGNALKTYQGSLIFVSHDRTFIENVATHILGVNQKGETLLVEGKWADFEWMASRSAFSIFNTDSPPAEARESSKKAGGNDKERKNRIKIQKRKLEELEKNLEVIDLEIKNIDKSFHVVKELAALIDLQKKKDTLLQKQESLEKEWISLSEQDDGGS